MKEHPTATASPSFKIRLAEPADKSAFIDLWRICFTDTEEFIGWFFEHRFFPEFSVCVESDGRIISAMQSMPLSLWIRGRKISGAIVVGVCTHPDFRGRHLMKDMFTFYMEQMGHKGLLAITYKPENIGAYFSLGHYPTTRTFHLSVPTGSDSQSPSSHFPMQKLSFTNSAIRALPPRDLLQCFALYASTAPFYSGIVDRDERLFALKSQDYASTGGKALLCRRGDRTMQKAETGGADAAAEPATRELSGYCFYFESETEIYGEELLARNPAVLFDMILAFRSLSEGRLLKLKIPSNFKEFPLLNVKASPQNVMGVTDIAEFVRQLGLIRFESPEILRELVFQVVDPIRPKNTVVIDLLGEPSSLPPCLTIGVGYFVQLLCGYHSLAFFDTRKDYEASPEKEAPPFQIHDAWKAALIDRILPLCDCFIVDEY